MLSADEQLMSGVGTTRKKGVWPEWVGKPAPCAEAVPGVRCTAPSLGYSTRLYRRDLTLCSPKGRSGYPIFLLLIGTFPQMPANPGIARLTFQLVEALMTFLLL